MVIGEEPPDDDEDNERRHAAISHERTFVKPMDSRRDLASATAASSHQDLTDTVPV